MNRREFIFGSGAFALSPTIGFGKPISEHSDELNDLIEFSKTCNIVNLKDGVTKFNPRPYQIEYFKNILESNTLVCMKCRQCGATTMNLIYAHWMAERHQEKKVILVYNKWMMVQDAKNIFNSMFYHNPSKWNENLPNVEFVTYDSLYRELNQSIFTRTRGDKYIEFSSNYFDSNVVLIFDEYAFMPYGNMVLNVVDSNKTIWVSTPNEPNDILWGNGKSYGKFNRMKITGEQVFPQYRLEEFKKFLGMEIYNQEIQV